MASTYLSKTFSASNRKTFTLSYWVKSGVDGYHFTVGSDNFNIRFQANTSFIGEYNPSASSYDFLVKTNRLLRDVSAWYHIVMAVDTTQATSSDRVKIYVNGVQETSLQTATYPSQNYDTSVNTNAQHNIGVNGGISNYFNGLFSHIHFIDGTAYDASTFGETDATTGIWKPKTSPSVTYGTNGFFLKFENSGSMGTDSSPNGNNFTVNGTLTQTVDTPSNVFSTLNAVNTGPYFAGTLSNGNLSYTNITAGNYYTPGSTLRVSLGKWYSEFKVQSATDWIAVGVDTRILTATNDHCGKTASGWLYVGGSSSGGSNSLYSASFTSYGDSYTTNDIIGVALDLDNKKLYFSKNGTWQNSGDPESGATGTGAIDISTIGNDVYFGVGNFSGINTAGWHCNFGNGYFGTTAVSSAGSNGNGAIFEYDVPTGYYALNTKNINTYG